MISIPRGLTTAAEGTFKPTTGDFDFDTNDRDSNFGVLLENFGTGERVKQRNYHITLKTTAGSVDCGSGC